MDIVTIGSFLAYGYFMYKLGQSTIRNKVGTDGFNVIVDRTKFPVAVAEKIDGNYYLYEKDSTNFLCQAEKLEDIPLRLWENKKISLAAIMCPEESANTVYWCVNGKLKIMS